MENNLTPAASNPAQKPHTRDTDCEDAETLDDDDNCTACGATFGDECPSCGGCRYHDVGCTESTTGVRVADGEDEAGAPGPKTERSMESWLEDAIRAACDEVGVGNGSVVNFVDAGIMTRNRGLVVRFGSVEFQISIVQSSNR